MSTVPRPATVFFWTCCALLPWVVGMLIILYELRELHESLHDLKIQVDNLR